MGIMPVMFVRQKDVAEVLCMTESWLEQKRLRGGGPPYYKIGKNVRYKISDVYEWAELQLRTSTSDSTEH
jgi:hypothetical protein